MTEPVIFKPTNERGQVLIADNPSRTDLYFPEACHFDRRRPNRGTRSLLKWRYGSNLPIVVEKSALFYVLFNLRPRKPSVAQLLLGAKRELVTKMTRFRVT